ncbi:DUF2213 domain-containing protein [Tranquillimonas rosea]|uniref:DUF2213 domain-containing protein n=1 Tax=Tranquillimonas rosea TaxID=641238 RepID=UPI003BA96FC0
MTEHRIAKDGEAVAAEVAMTDAAEQSARFVTTIDATPLTGVQRHRDGFVHGRVRATRTGIQEYRASELGKTGDEIVRVYRPLDEVMRVDSLGSFKGKAVTDGHPKERLNSENWGKLARGTIMSVQRDGEAVVLDVTVSDKALVDKLEAGEARELSAGYVARIDWTPGKTDDGEPYDAVQRDIYVDHLAVVPAGRAGKDFRIGDGADDSGKDRSNWGAAPIPQGSSTKGATMSDALRTIMVDGLSVSVTDQAAQAITKLQDAMTEKEKAIATKEAEIAELKKQVETKDGELAAAKKSLEDATKPEAIADAVKKRGKVTEAGKAAGMSEEDMDKMDDAAIRRAVVSKSLGDAAAKEMSDAAIEGAFLYASNSTAKTQDSALGGGIKTTDADPWGFMDKKEG